MKALVIDQPGTVKWAEVSGPAPGPDEIRVRVRATALNRADLLQSLGLYPAPPGVPSDIPGLEYSGEVDSVGPRISRFRPGDRVMGLVAGGAWGELLVVHEAEAMAIPPAIDFEHAAAIPEAFATAWDALVLQGGLRAGQWALIHAVGSGVGTAAIQVAAMVGARAIGTSRSAAKIEQATKIAPFLGLQTKAGVDFSSEVMAASGGRGADVVLDLVGGDLLPFTLACTAECGTVMLVGLTAGASAEVLPLRTLLARRITLRGTTLRARGLDERIALARRFEREVLPMFEKGRLKPVVSQVIDAGEANTALEAMTRNDTFGKTVLTFPKRGARRGV